MEALLEDVSAALIRIAAPGGEVRTQLSVVEQEMLSRISLAQIILKNNLYPDDASELPTDPVAPRRWPYVAAGLVAGVLAAVAIWRPKLAAFGLAGSAAAFALSFLIPPRFASREFSGAYFGKAKVKTAPPEGMVTYWRPSTS